MNWRTRRASKSFVPAEWAPPHEGENRAYTPFILLSSPRSGTSMVIQALRSHPDAMSFGEVFHLKHIGFNTPGFDNADPGLLAWRDRAPDEFLRSAIFRGYRDEICAVGFKIFYRDVDRSRFRTLGASLRSVPGLRVLHMMRENLLRSFLSAEIAGRTGVWGVQAPEQRPAIRVRLEPGKCVRYFERVEASRETYAELFTGCPTEEVVFEAFVADPDGGLGRIQDFLGLGRMGLRPENIRQEVRPLSVAIRNYRDVQAALSGSRWAGFLDE